jgi:hypothetical protein
MAQLNATAITREFFTQGLPQLFLQTKRDLEIQVSFIEKLSPLSVWTTAVISLVLLTITLFTAALTHDCS